MISSFIHARQHFLSAPATDVRRLFSHVGLLAVLGVGGTLALLPSLPAQAQDHVCRTNAANACIPGHMYLNNPDGTVTDVTSTYVQTGTAYDAQKGYTVQTGHLRDAAGNSIDVTVDTINGTIDGWKSGCIGFIAPQATQFHFRRN